MSGVYTAPQEYGLETVGEIEWSGESYEFDLTAIWRDPQTGQLYWGDDSGCSCPVPFEDVHTRAGLTAGTADELDAHLRGRLKDARRRDAASGVADLMVRIKARRDRG